MTEKMLFDFSSGLLTSDNFNIELKGYFVGTESKDRVHEVFKIYTRENSFDSLMVLIEESSIHKMSPFNSLELDELNLVTINAMQSDEAKYAINPDLEGRKMKKGFFSRFKRG